MRPVKLKDLIIPLEFLLYLISFFIPRDRDIWVIGNRFGKSYGDNPKFLFEYIRKYHPQKKVFFITKNREILKNNNDLNFLFYLNPKAVYYSLRAKIAIVSFSRTDLPSYLLGGAIWINLHHGNTIKKNSFTIGQKFFYILSRYVFKYKSTQYDYMTVSNINHKLIDDFKLFFGVREFFLTGLPRNDLFYEKDTTQEIFYRSDHKVILYAPTFRTNYYNIEYDLFTNFGWDSELIEMFLKKNKLILVLKPHPHLLFPKKIKEFIAKKSLHIFYNNSSDVQPILKETDFLITDYSGIYIDFLHLKRPIIFAPFDFDYFSLKEGLAYDYDKITKQYKISNWGDFLNINFNSLTFDNDHQTVFDFFDSFQDGNNSERVFNKINSIT